MKRVYPKYTRAQLDAAWHNWVTFGYDRLTEREKDIIDFITGG